MRTTTASPRPESYGNVPVTPWHMIERFHDEGVAAGLQSDPDGITVWIGEVGDKVGARIRTQRKFARHEFDEIAAWLAQESQRLSMNA
jgi:hypothetical protein